MNDSFSRVAVVGAGDRFASLVALLQANDIEMVRWVPDDFDADDDAGCDQVDLEALAETPVIFLAVPFTTLREVSRTLGDVMTARHAIIHSCHNLESGSLASASQVLVEETPTRRFGFLTGPMRSQDVGAGLPAAGVCASRFPEVWALCEELLVHDRFRLYRSPDIVGAEHAAAYGRVIAMATGVASEMKLGQSVLATLFARGLAEVARWVKLRGAAERTTFGIAGAGNLHLDTSGDGSIDFQVGAAAMREGVFDPVKVRKTFGPTGRDLLDLVTALWDGVQSSQMSAHILHTCHLMVSEELGPQEAVAHLMTLPTLADD